MSSLIWLFVLVQITLVVCCFWSPCPLYDTCGGSYKREVWGEQFLIFSTPLKTIHIPESVLICWIKAHSNSKIVMLLTLLMNSND